MITAAFTTFNRTQLLFEAVAPLLEHDLVSDVVIVDDCSTDAGVWIELVKYAALSPKIRLFRNDKTKDCYFNKREAVSKAANEWVLILDSDNIFSKQYIDRIETLITAGLNIGTVYQPSFAQPHFNFTKYEGTLITKENVHSYMIDPTFQTMLNAFNYFVNREEYLRVFDASVDPVTSDSIFHNYNWLKAGNSIYIVPNLEYGHRVHDQSHYKNNVRRTPRHFHEDVVRKLNELR